MKKLLAVAAILAGVASPAFAQAFDPEMGTGNVLPFSYEPVAAQTHRVPVNHNGLRAFAMVPDRRAGGIDSPALNGGGSTGYNENLRTNY